MDIGHSGQSLAEPTNGGVRVGIVRPRQLLDSRQFKRHPAKGKGSSPDDSGDCRGAVELQAY